MAEKGSVTKSIAHYIKNKIETGEWGLGQRIPGEIQICEELSVSRVSVRRALQEFTKLGILESTRGRGTFVVSTDLSVFTPVSTDFLPQAELVGNLEDIRKVRLLLEPSICRQAATEATPELIARLTEIIGRMQSAIGDNEKFSQADTQFHIELCKACNNPVLVEILSGLFQRRAMLADVKMVSFEFYGGLYYHNLILECIKKKNGKKAKELMEEHLNHGVLDLNLAKESE